MELVTRVCRTEDTEELLARTVGLVTLV
jgi:hypothetical protein